MIKQVGFAHARFSPYVRFIKQLHADTQLYSDVITVTS